MNIKTSSKVPQSEYDVTFLQGMVNRMAMSYYKYGAVADAFPSKVDAIESLKLRLDKYIKTGNTEWLMDVANFAMIEFMHPKLEGAFFKATDSKESPGRITRTARRIYDDHNSEVEMVI